MSDVMRGLYVAEILMACKHGCVFLQRMTVTLMLACRMH